MDNVTHSLVGALLGQMGLKRRTGLAMPTLIIAANLPDIDASCTVLGMVSLAMRRGVTHGPIAMLFLPLLLTGAMIAYDRWQTRRGKRPAGRLPVRAGWLLALAYIGCLSHPLFDWMNSYGVRLLEPFSHRWFYGDALFIVDPWLLAMLGSGIWLSRRRERRAAAAWASPARTASLAVIAYIGLNLVISHLAVQRVLEIARTENELPPVRIVANPVALTFWKRDVLWQGVVEHSYSFGTVKFDAFSPSDYRRYEIAHFGGEAHRLLARHGMRSNWLGDPEFAALVIRRAASDPEARAFLFWTRLPVVEHERADDPIILRDQRFMDSMTGSRFQVRLAP